MYSTHCCACKRFSCTLARRAAFSIIAHDTHEKGRGCCILARVLFVIVTSFLWCLSRHGCIAACTHHMHLG